MAGSETERRDEAVEENANSDVEVLRSGREEARVVLNHQLQVLNDLHTKAIRTVRITGLVFGLLLSTGTLLGAKQFTNGYTLVGVGALALAILSGLVADSASDPKVGIGPQYLSDVRTGQHNEAEWYGSLVSGYEDWIGEMEELNDGNARMLTLTQILLGVGVVFLAVGIFVDGFT